LQTECLFHKSKYTSLRLLQITERYIRYIDILYQKV